MQSDCRPPTESTADEAAPFSTAPAFLVSVAFLLGILLNHFQPLSSGVWIAALAAICLAWLSSLMFGKPLWSTVALLIGVAVLGGIRHHFAWNVTAVDDIGRWAFATYQPIHLHGVITGDPVRQQPSSDERALSWKQGASTLCELRCRRLQTRTGFQNVSGKVRLQIDGERQDLQVGDVVEAFGNLVELPTPRNPGEFDFGSYLRRQGISAQVYCEYPESLHVLRTEDGWTLPRLRNTVRRRIKEMLNRSVAPRVLPLAQALLLGDRSQITRDLRDAFIHSGTMHLLAISGLHVGILAGLVWLICRLGRVSMRGSAVLLLTVLIAYALLTETRPSVIRATVFLSLLILGWWNFRVPAMFNVLMLTLLLMLIWNPLTAFDSGAQLSFLAVGAILVFQTVWQRWGPVDDPVARAELQDNPRWWFIAWQKVKRSLLIGYGMTAAIYLVTVPWVMAWFHHFSLTGLLINALLMPLVIIVLWSGFVLLVCGCLIPPLAAPLGAIFSGSLGLFLTIVETAARPNGGHFYLAGPSAWWLAGFYVLLVLLAFAVSRNRSTPRLVVYGLWTWVLTGMFWWAFPQKPGELRCTFLSVGHGCSVLVEFPGGRTLLYDAGSLASGRRAERVITGYLWHRGRSSLDSIVLSHADIDHFNAVPGLMRQVPIGTLCCSPLMVERTSRGVESLLDEAAAHDIPVQWIVQGQNLLLDDEVVVRVLHPPQDAALGTDNESSVVLLIEYAGRHVLLTGDVDREGMELLLEQRIDGPIDVMQSPHHGSRTANPPELVNWADPRNVVISGSRPDLLESLAAIYTEKTGLFCTQRDGAVTFHIAPSGDLRADRFLSD